MYLKLSQTSTMKLYVKIFNGREFFMLIWKTVHQFWTKGIWLPKIQGTKKKKTCELTGYPCFLDSIRMSGFPLPEEKLNKDYD